MKITPEEIRSLARDEIFVYGSNEAGIPGAGAARLAFDEFGTVPGQGFGMMGQSFAIPTKDWEIQVLPLSVIKHYIDRFTAFANRPLSRGWKFLVTRIGCGLAGYTAEEIAPLFKEVKELKNIYLPQEFLDILQNR